MTDPDRVHPADPAEGADPQGEDRANGRTPHPEEPAEGAERDAAADTPDRP